MADDVLFEKRDDGIAIITLNRPDSLNAMGGMLMPMLADYLNKSAYDTSVRCVVLTGAGRAFCAGGDVKSMQGGGVGANTGNGAAQSGPPTEIAAPVPAPAERRSAFNALDPSVGTLRQSQMQTSYVLHTMGKPTIAAVNGHAVGAGLSLALACDLRIASDKAKFGTAFRNVALSGDFGGSYYMQRLVGMGKARELYLTAEIIEAGEAMRIGMVTRVVPHDSLMDEAMQWAEKMASGPTATMARTKENLNLGEYSDLRTLMDQEAFYQRLTSLTNDHREAVKAFVEKRQPKFAGN